jgi:hypothetical protein
VYPPSIFVRGALPFYSRVRGQLQSQHEYKTTIKSNTRPKHTNKQTNKEEAESIKVI